MTSLVLNNWALVMYLDVSANRIIEHYWMYEWRKALMILCAYAGWSESVFLCMFEGTFLHDMAYILVWAQH